MLLSEGRMSDYKGAALLLPVLPKAKELLADRGYDADWFRTALLEKGVAPCIPPRKNRKTRIDYDKTLYRQRHKIENMFGKLKDWRRIATRYDRCAHTFFSAIRIAATFIFYLNSMSPEPRDLGVLILSAYLMSTLPRASGLCCIRGCDRIGASRKKNCRSTWVSFSSCTTLVFGARACLDLTWNC